MHNDTMTLEMFSALLTFREGMQPYRNAPATVEFPSQKASNDDISYFLFVYHEHGANDWVAGDLRRHSGHVTSV